MRIRTHYGNYGFFLTSADFIDKKASTGNGPRNYSDGEGWEPYPAKIEAQGYRRNWLEFISIGNFRNR